MAPTSEQELKQLLEEGKITEEEYEQLLDAMQKNPQPPVQQINSAPTKTKPKHRLGIIAFFLMLAGIIATVLGFVLIFIGMVPRMGMLLVLFVFAVEVLALILGIIAFSSGWGKAAAICAPCYSFLVLPVIILVVIFFATQVHRIEVQENPPPMTALILKQYPMDSLEGLLTQSDVTLDKNLSVDGNGSIKFESKDIKKVFRLFEFEDVQRDNIVLSYRAKLCTSNLKGKAYIEMLCNLPGKGEFFSRSLEDAVSGDVDWVTLSTPFILHPGQKPDRVKLNLVIEGTGTVWIDDIRLLSTPSI